MAAGFNEGAQGEQGKNSTHDLSFSLLVAKE